MTKEQFHILLKAKHIITEQAQDALLYLQSCEIKEALIGHVSFHRSAFEERNYKISTLIAKSLAKYLPLVDDDVDTATIYLVMTFEAMLQKQYGEVLNLFQQFKSLEVIDQKLNINFDLLMFHIFAEFKLFVKCRFFAENIMRNPYIYNISIPEITHFYSICTLLCYENNDANYMSYCYQEMKKIVDGNFNEETRDIGRQDKQIVEILQGLLNAKTKEEEQLFLANYKQISACYIEYPTTIVSKNYEIDYHILHRFMVFKDYDFIVSRATYFLKLASSIRMKTWFQELKTQALKEMKHKDYLSNLERLCKMQAKNEKELSFYIKDAYVSSYNTIDLHDGIVRLQKQYEYDELTRAYSRNILYQRAKDMFIRNKTATILFMDIDNLKEVNDHYSHQAGDEYLKLFVQTLKSIMPIDAQIFRYGGDEFVMLLPGDDEQTIRAMLQKLQDKFTLSQNILSQSIMVRYSVGIACYPRHGRDIQEVLSCADYKMYEAKRNHRGRHILSETSLVQ